MLIRKVVIPLAISEISAEILPVIRRLFAPEQTLLTLVAVAQPVDLWVLSDCAITGLPFAAYAWATSPEEWEAYRSDLKARLEGVAVELRQTGYLVSTTVLVGSTVAAIANFVERHSFDLLAMATYGRTGLDRLIHGSVAEQLLRRVSVPMLLMRPPAAVIEQNHITGPQVRADSFDWHGLATETGTV